MPSNYPFVSLAIGLGLAGIAVEAIFRYLDRQVYKPRLASRQSEPDLAIGSKPNTAKTIRDLLNSLPSDPESLEQNLRDALENCDLSNDDFVYSLLDNTELLYSPDHWELTANVEDQNMLNLLYLMAEDQSRRTSHCHRGVTCNTCGATPIRGIRYKCAECIDVDICQYCEASAARIATSVGTSNDIEQHHSPAHTLIKIRTPIPITVSPRWAIASWRPPSAIAASAVGKDYTMSCLDESCEYQLAAQFFTSVYDIRAKYAKFRCLVDIVPPASSSNFLEDSILDVGVSQTAFKYQFFASCPNSLVACRVATVYDRNNDGVITFEDFLYVSRIGTVPGEDMHTALKVFELDNNGYVHVSYVLKVLRSLVQGMRTSPLSNSQYTLTQSAIDDGILSTSRPISSSIGGAAHQSSSSTGTESKYEKFLSAPDLIKAVEDNAAGEGNVRSSVQDIIMAGIEKAVYKAWAGWPPVIKNDLHALSWDNKVQHRMFLYMWFYEYRL